MTPTNRQKSEKILEKARALLDDQAQLSRILQNPHNALSHPKTIMALESAIMRHKLFLKNPGNHPDVGGGI